MSARKAKRQTAAQQQIAREVEHTAFELPSALGVHLQRMQDLAQELAEILGLLREHVDDCKGAARAAERMAEEIGNALDVVTLKQVAIAEDARAVRS